MLGIGDVIELIVGKVEVVDYGLVRIIFGV